MVLKILKIRLDASLAKALRRFATCLLVSNNLSGKLASLTELPIIFDDNLKITSVTFFFAEFNLLGCLHSNYCIRSFYIKPKVII